MDFFCSVEKILGCVKQLRNSKSLSSSKKSRNFEIMKSSSPIWSTKTERENNVFLNIRKKRPRTEHAREASNSGRVLRPRQIILSED